MSIESVFFDSGAPGVRLVVFGAVHGNEHCGPKAMARIMERIRSGTLRLISGSVRFVPVCNARAYELRVRQTEENLNRIFRKTAGPKTYEARLANELCSLLDTEADALLDIHSTSAPGPMSLFIDHPTPQNEKLAADLGAQYILLDWPAVYANSPDFDADCTSDYAHEIGIPSVTVECGQHDDPATVECAERAILRGLSSLGIAGTRNEPLPAARRIRMKVLHKKKAEGDAFSKPWEHLEPLPAGTLIAVRESGEEIRAGEDGVMLLPKHHAKAGEEWFYLGVFET